MVWRHRGVDIPPKVYHSLPKGWSADEIFASHKLMRGAYPLSDFEIGKWGAPSYMTERFEWLRYKETLNRVSAGIRSGDEACNEIRIRYIELRYIGSYSGFIRAKIARALRSAFLEQRQKERLNKNFMKIVDTSDYTEEWREYWKLWSFIVTEPILIKLNVRFQVRSEGVAPSWLPKMIAAYRKRG